MTELRQTFRPEFLNRLDEVICFTPLGEGEIRQIGEKMLQSLADRLEWKGVKLEVREGALAVLGRQGGSAEYGARPLRRFLRAQLEEPAADALLSGALTDGDTLRVDGTGENLTLEVRKG